MSNYPECDKWAEASGERATIEAFLNWLNEHKIVLCSPGKFDEWRPIAESRDYLLACFYGVDLTKLEGERRAILKAASVQGTR